MKYIKPATLLLAGLAQIASASELDNKAFEYGVTELLNPYVTEKKTSNGLTTIEIDMAPLRCKLLVEKQPESYFVKTNDCEYKHPFLDGREEAIAQLRKEGYTVTPPNKKK